MQKTIYVSSQEIWDSVRKEAKKYGKGSVSGYLLKLHFSNLGYQDSVKPADSEKFESHKPKEEITREPAMLDNGYVEGQADDSRQEMIKDQIEIVEGLSEVLDLGG